MMRKIMILFIMLLPYGIANAQRMKAIFNGSDFTGWNIFLEKQGLNKEGQDVFKVEDGEIHVSGQQFGYIATIKSYQNFHLSLAFKWGEKKYPPRETEKRDAGICFYVDTAMNHIWPKSIECQIQEGDVGDLWLIGNRTATVAGVKTIPKDYARVAKTKDAELPNGKWNRVEVIAKNGTFKFLVNGILVNEGTDLSVTNGRILLQSEGAELFYKDIKIKEL